MSDLGKIMKVGSLASMAMIMVMCSSCDGEKRQVRISDKQIQESLVESNKAKARKEAEEIKAYINEKGLDMIATGTGLHYHVYEEGSGTEFSKTGQEATVHYSIFLLNDTMCYTSRETEPATFKIGLSGVESGLHEGLTYLKEGDKAKFIMPSHLAYGAFGDRKKIPPQTPLMYDIELITLK